ncbi:hypothetical protein ACGF1Z_34585 [Streptomyces sp. NPDC048018]|uniref:hypothetical protein n=1 Tax=Streptomyces sp. NPDC048018 TaxID=3365499 RepID=UPI003717FC2C
MVQGGQVGGDGGRRQGEQGAGHAQEGGADPYAAAGVLAQRQAGEHGLGAVQAAQEVEQRHERTGG